VVTEYVGVSASDLVPTVVAEHWAEAIPIHGMVILDAMRPPDGGRALHVVHDTGCPPWTLIGMLRAVCADLETRWAEETYQDVDDYEDDDDE
jgi:hypothetical protein